MSADLIFCGGQVATPKGFRRLDVSVRRGRILKVAKSSASERRGAKHLVDAKDCLVLPGAVDPHVHFDLGIGPGMRSADDSRAALAGGVTSVIDYTGPQPGQSPRQAFAERLKQASGWACDFSFHNVLIDWRDEWAKELHELARAGSPSVKLFMIYKDRGWQAHDGMMHEVMTQCRRHDLVVCVHAENDALIDHFTAKTLALSADKRPGASALAISRPPLVEWEAVGRAIALAEDTGARLHLVHLSTARSAELVGQARKKGLLISGETCPHYLSLDQKLLSRPEGHRNACCPPLRTAKERQGLFKALKENWLQAVATDHCNFSSELKDSWGGDFQHIPYGLAGVETSLSITWTLGPEKEKMDPARWVEMHSAGPAKLFGMYPKKGAIVAGADADLIVWDPQHTKTLRAARLETHGDHSAYEGRRVKGQARQVYLRGSLMAEAGRYVGRADAGQLIKRKRS
ncbi:MAG: amidohydrolase family protein [Deltaproteobacteria bacterium]|nr:amidohydrolase family protein [Deltaproteobacteria bacterium]